MSKTLSITKLDEIIKSKLLDSTHILTYETKKGSIEIEVKYTITLEDMCSLVAGTVSNLFKENGDGETVYCPELYDVSMAANILDYYTNIKTELGNNRLVELVYCTGIMEDIVAQISSVQYNKITDYVERRIRFICESIHAEQLSKLSIMASKIDNAANAFGALNEQFSALGEDKLQRVANSLIKMTPTTLTEAVVEARDQP